MTAHYLMTVTVATLAQFIAGAIWYTPLFGKLWGKIHGFDKLDKKQQQKMMSEMGPIFAAQLLVTLLTSVILVALRTIFFDYSLLMLTFGVWLGFVVPAQVSGNLFGGLPYKWIGIKSAVMAGGSLVALMTGAAVVGILMA